MRPFTAVNCRLWLLWLASTLCVLACSGPRDATPLPEPPALRPERIGIAGGAMALTPTIRLSGSANAAPANAVVRVTNLDSSSPPIATTATASGAFELTVPGVPGDELRFQALIAEQRSPPVDLVFVNGPPPSLVQSPRHACVSLNPGFELLFAAPGSAELTLRNECSEALGISNPRQRRELPSFALSSVLPLELAPGESVDLSVAFSGTAGAELEETLFVDLTNQGTTLRYPITLAAP